jgi:hypothetical protein
MIVTPAHYRNERSFSLRPRSVQRIAMTHIVPLRPLRRLPFEEKLNRGMIFVTQRARLAINSFAINNSALKSSSIFVDFYRFFAPKHPFSTQKPPLLVTEVREV